MFVSAPPEWITGSMVTGKTAFARKASSSAYARRMYSPQSLRTTLAMVSFPLASYT